MRWRPPCRTRPGPGTPGRRTAAPPDHRPRPHVGGKVAGMEGRAGEVIEVRGSDGSPPYVVRFSDGRESLVRPGPDAVVESGTPSRAPDQPVRCPKWWRSPRVILCGITHRDVRFLARSRTIPPLQPDRRNECGSCYVGNAATVAEGFGPLGCVAAGPHPPPCLPRGSGVPTYMNEE
ncbi:DUF1918 domain-containing protein [Nocardiopsis deserti]|uniref:DUF1918 domain-containing protein n=1 Tax=Nocardiopsis deserti TaxID=2605988 RepID=UPI0037446C4F